ncbi:MAG TPA: ABC transporter, partial [Rubrivivax sp.]|nr:ABC transporter [Rubrivivax sp.]
TVSAISMKRVSAIGEMRSFRSLWARLKAFKAQREALTQAKSARQELAANILRQLLEKAAVLKGFYEPVQKLLDEEPEIATRLGVQFSLRITFDDFLLNVFDYLKQNTGALYGQAESAKTVKALVDKHDLTDPADLAAFLSEFEALLGKEPHELAALLRTAKHPQEFLDFLYGLTYADLKYGLLLKGVELERLSPGQRGALLLIFYLLVDQDRAPIILDQPEENLDNETVYNLLVTVIHRARANRQVILVTHNANLAVACDAEQIIVCGLETTPVGPRITYTSGAIEEAEIRRAVVDVLEGTQPAFDNRRRKYG